VNTLPIKATAVPIFSMLSTCYLVISLNMIIRAPPMPVSINTCDIIVYYAPHYVPVDNPVRAIAAIKQFIYVVLSALSLDMFKFIYFP